MSKRLTPQQSQEVTQLREQHLADSIRLKGQRWIVHSVVDARTAITAHTNRDPDADVAVKKELARIETEAIEDMEPMEDKYNSTLYKAGQDYRQNQEAYEQTAIDEANKADHDIVFGGRHYPAQPPEQPKE